MTSPSEFTVVGKLYYEVDEIRFRRHPDHEPRAQLSEFDMWVSANNVPASFEYSKGWWDYVELVRRFATRLDTVDVRVIGHYVVDTPPPQEQLPMPAVALSVPGVTFALRFDSAAGHGSTRTMPSGS